MNAGDMGVARYGKIISALFITTTIKKGKSPFREKKETESFISV